MSDEFDEKHVPDEEKRTLGVANAIEHRKLSGANLHEYSEAEGYIIDAENAAGLKVASDGRTVLIPQPSEDPNDPLNWSKFRKHLILIIISMTAFLPDYGCVYSQEVIQMSRISDTP